MKMTRDVKTIIGKDSRGPLHHCIAELEEDKSALQHTVDHGIEDYEPLLVGNEKLASERDKLKHHCKDLQAELGETRSDAQKGIKILKQKLSLSKLTASMSLSIARNV
jgi:translation initiation factor 2 beta subunit (eIF-2beta)/eIF-5